MDTEGYTEGFIKRHEDDWELVDDDIVIFDDDGSDATEEEEKADAILGDIISEKPTLVSEVLAIANDRKKEIARSVMLNIILYCLKNSHQYSLCANLVSMHLVCSSISLAYMMIKYRRFAYRILVLCRLPIF